MFQLIYTALKLGLIYPQLFYYLLGSLCICPPLGIIVAMFIFRVELFVFKIGVKIMIPFILGRDDLYESVLNYVCHIQVE